MFEDSWITLSAHALMGSLRFGFCGTGLSLDPWRRGGVCSEYAVLLCEMGVGEAGEWRGGRKGGQLDDAVDCV